MHKTIEEYLSRTGFESFNPKVALIDMDGTLYDSMPHHADAWMQLMKEYSLKATREEFFMFEGRTGASTINIIFNRTYGHDATPEQCREMYHRKTELFSAMPPVEPMPGASEMLCRLKEKGMRCVVVTGSGQGSLLDRLQSDFPGVFAPGDLISSRDVKHGKPHPEPYLLGLERTGAMPWEAVGIENAPLGVESVSRAEIFTIGVVTGPIPYDNLKRAGADIVYKSMPECAKNISGLLFA